MFYVNINFGVKNSVVSGQHLITMYKATTAYTKFQNT